MTETMPEEIWAASPVQGPILSDRPYYRFWAEYNSSGSSTKYILSDKFEELQAQIKLPLLASDYEQTIAELRALVKELQTERYRLANANIELRTRLEAAENRCSVLETGNLCVNQTLIQTRETAEQMRVALEEIAETHDNPHSDEIAREALAAFNARREK